MRVGVLFPQTEIGSDPGGVRAYATAAEELGYRHLLTYEHVLGADPAVHGEISGPYDIADSFHEPLVLFGYLAAIVSLELVTGILILPQRQTALVAKQAAEVDLLTGGRLRLGVGLGWNAVEYEALGQEFSTRGARLEDQVHLLRKLWTERSVTHIGPFDRVTGAGLSPMPTQRPIPIWFGAMSPPALRRAGRLAEGWFPQVVPGAALDAAKAIVDGAAESAGRDPSAIGMEGRVDAGDDESFDRLERHCARWRDAGASHLSVNTMGFGLAGPDGHIEALKRAAEVLEPRQG